MFDADTGLVISIEKKLDGVFLIKAKGRIDTETHMILDRKIKPILLSSTKLIILDMEGVNYISSAGLSVIFQIKKVLESNKGSLITVSLQPQVKKVFDIMKALPSQNIFQNMMEVDSYLDMIQKKEIKRQKGEIC